MSAVGLQKPFQRIGSPFSLNRLSVERILTSIGAKAAHQRAEERLAKEKDEEIDFMRAKAALARAILRIRLAQSRSI